jgi:uncharacterized protein YxeA
MKWMVIIILIMFLIVGYTSWTLWKNQNETSCNPPYIKYNDQCCLDQNSDGLCDKAESQPTTVDSWQSAINAVDRLETNYTLNCKGGIKENVLYIVHVIKSQDYIECSKLKERIDVVKAKPGIFDNYLKIIDDCNSNTIEALSKTLKGFSYGRLLPLRKTISNSDDFYYIYSGCVHEPDNLGSIFSFFQMAVDTGSGVAVGMNTAR